MTKIKFFTRFLMTIFIILIFYVANFAQFEKYFVAAQWEYYSVKDKNVSILMPRLPVLINQGNQCRGEETRNYAAYNDGTVYVLRITSKIDSPSVCLNRKKFDEVNFRERVMSLKNEMKSESALANNISKDSVIKLVGANAIVKLINDYENKRWFELSIYGADENKTEVQNFFASLKTKTNGIEIGQGAKQTFGDDATDSIVQVKTVKTAETEKGKVETLVDSSQLLVKTSDLATKGVRIVLKPRANYTDTARENKVSGKVVLRVTFLANGAIGNIEVVSGLGSGLTDEATKAARKIVFIPAQGNGKRVSVTKPVEYTFTIY